MIELSASSTAKQHQAHLSPNTAYVARFAVGVVYGPGISSPTHRSLGLTRPRRDLTLNPIPPPGTRVPC